MDTTKRRIFRAARLHLARELLYTLLPWAVFNGISLFVCSVLNAGERFAFLALAPAPAAVRRLP